VFVTHLSYADTQQCLNAAALLFLMDSRRLARGSEATALQLVLGDFNTYFGFEWPMELLNGNFVQHAKLPCVAPWRETQTLTTGFDPANPASQSTSLTVPPAAQWFGAAHGNGHARFRDVWRDLHSDKGGFTFTNTDNLKALWDDNLPNRPDR
jgi:hypothetical protein